MESNTSTTGLIIISKLYQEGRINDEDRERLKGKFSFHIKSLLKSIVYLHFYIYYDIDMIFNEDAILLQLFNIIEDEDELKEAVLKYCNGGIMEVSRPAVIDAS